jgi:hypothetical protein
MQWLSNSGSFLNPFCAYYSLVFAFSLCLSFILPLWPSDTYDVRDELLATQMYYMLSPR